MNAKKVITVGTDKNQARDMDTFKKSYKSGIEGERAILRYFAKLGFNVIGSDTDDNIFNDIDGFINTTSVSIKCQDSATDKRYPRPHFYFEIEAELTATGEWVPSWFYTGKAQKYIIAHQNTLYVLNREVVHEYIAKHGWSYTRCLSKSVRAGQGGTYRYSNARCGFIACDELPIEKVFHMPEGTR